MEEFRKQIIKNWMERAEEKHRSPSPGFNIGFFHADSLISCSIAFEAYAFGKFQKTLVSENRRELSRYFQTSYEELIENDPPCELKEALDNLKREIDRKTLEDMTPNSTRNPLDAPDQRNLDRILEIIYRVRSNLLHGGKEVNPTITRNMILIRASFIILFHVMKMIIGKENLIQQ